MTTKLIGVGGFARSGKDTFVGISKKILERNGYNLVRVAFADKLKEEIDLMLQTNNFSADVYTQDTQTKSLIRPLMVWWGCQRRNESNGLYWVKNIDEKIKNFITECFYADIDTSKLVFMISDVRFPNEATWLHDSWDGKFIHLRRYSNVYSESPVVINGVSRNDLPIRMFDSAPNEEEEAQDPLIQEIADYKLEWENKGNLPLDEAIKNQQLQEEVLKTLNGLKYFNEILS